MNQLFEELTNFQVKVARWSDNTPDSTAIDKFDNVAVELGMLAHSKVRKNAEEEKAAIGRLVVTLADYCHKRQISLAQCVGDEWAKMSRPKQNT